MIMWLLTSVAVACALVSTGASPNSTETWLSKRDALIDEVYGYGKGVLPNRSEPDQLLSWPETPSIQGLVWNMTRWEYRTRPL
jgi:hypothetical protein